MSQLIKGISSFVIYFTKPFTKKKTSDQKILLKEIFAKALVSVKKISHINYENFVNDFVNNSKEIINFLDLKWEDQIKNYDKNTRPVTTASFQQVREGIKKNTSLAWKKYSNYLRPMQETLNSMKIKF